MFVLENGDKLQGDASAATVVDYHISGITGGTTLKNLADGQLPATIGDLYTSASTDAATTITLVNTDSVARTVNLYHTPSGGTARRVIPKDLSLSAGYSVVIDGGDIRVIGTDGSLQTSADVGTIAHERGGLEADVSAYSGLVKITGGATSAVDDLHDTATTKGDLLVRGASALGRVAVGSNDQMLVADSAEASGVKWTDTPSESFVIACSDETTDIAVATGVVTFRMPYAFTVTEVRASATTAPTGATITVDINESGSSILSTKLTIDATEKTSETAATAAVISDSALADDAEITIDIDQVGSTLAGAGLKVYIIGKQA